MGIRVNALAPGPTDTQATSHSGPTIQFSSHLCQIDSVTYVIAASNVQTHCSRALSRRPPR